MLLKTFADILGHEASIERLRRDLMGGSAPHAYLFVGPDGVGKSIVAKAVAASLLCLDPSPEKRPCGKCNSCGKIDRGNHPDFHTLSTDKGRKQIRIDQIRELQGALALRPYEAEWKTAIISPADDMNEAAQNAMLKTLEEPPGSAMIILVASSAQNMLPTIVSRSRIERFGPLPTDRLSDMLATEMKISKESASLLARLAGGSAGRAMEMEMDFAVKERPETIRKLVEISLSNKPREAEKVIEAAELVAEGGDRMLDALAGFFKDVAFASEGIEDFTHADLEREIRAFASKFAPDEISRRFAAVMATRDNLDRNMNKAFAYETLVLSIT